MSDSVFYSWQSDLPNAANRGFIETALQRAVTAVATTPSLALDVAMDRDTLGLPGAPDIAAGIFDKIACAAVFVADISIINGPHNQGRRLTPNPNVLVELGYALHALGPARVLLVFNIEYGSVDDLPFDLRPRRIMTYRMAERALSRSGERNKLEEAFTRALRTIFTTERQAPVALASTSGQRGKRLALAIELMNNARPVEGYSPSRVAELLGFTHANEIEHYIDGTAEPSFALLDRFADHFGASAEWLKHGRGAPFWSAERGGSPLACLERIRALQPERVLLIRSSASRGESGIVLKLSRDKYVAFRDTWAVSGDVGAGGQRLIVELYDVIRSLRNEHYSGLGGRLYGQDVFAALMHGELYPGYVEKGGSYESAWWDDFADAETPYFTDEQLTNTWGRGLVKAIHIVRSTRQSDNSTDFRSTMP